MTNDEKLMQQVLDTMRHARVFVISREKIKQPEGIDLYDAAIETLRTRLAQPEQEPVAQVDYNERGNICWLFGKQVPDKTLLYTAPPQREWQGLTAKDLVEIPPSCYEGAIWADARLKEKNT